MATKKKSKKKKPLITIRRLTKREQNTLKGGKRGMTLKVPIGGKFEFKIGRKTVVTLDKKGLRVHP